MSSTEADLDEALGDLGNDILWMLIAAFVLQSRSRFEGVGSWGSQHLGEELFMLEALQRDIVMRLLTLDDDERGQRSFRSVAKALKAGGVLKGGNQVAVDAAIRDYRALINTMKTKHRNAYIGHMKEGESATPRLPQVPEEFGTAIARAVEVLDQISGVRKGYTFKLSGGRQIDLRAALGV